MKIYDLDCSKISLIARNIYWIHGRQQLCSAIAESRGNNGYDMIYDILYKINGMT